MPQALVAIMAFIATVMNLACYVIDGAVLYLVLAGLFAISTALLLRASYRSLG